MRDQLVSFFKYNDWAFRHYLAAVSELPDKKEALKFLSHLISSQNKWLNRILKETDDNSLSWFGPEYVITEIEEHWNQSYTNWMSFLDNCTDSDLLKYIFFNRTSDHKPLKVMIKDIAFQLNCHNIHHRAQIARILRDQGVKPPASDYIHTMVEEA